MSKTESWRAYKPKRQKRRRTTITLYEKIPSIEYFNHGIFVIGILAEKLTGVEGQSIVLAHISNDGNTPFATWLKACYRDNTFFTLGHYFKTLDNAKTDYIKRR